MAGERAEIVAEIQAAFDNELSDAVKAIVFTTYDDDEYSPSTGQTTKVIEDTESTRGIQMTEWQYEIFSSNIEPTDEMIMVLQDELTLVPEIGTRVQFDGRTSRVIEKKADPMNVTWELRLRY